MWKSLFSGLLVLFAIDTVQMHSYHMGACPTIAPALDFNMNRLLGIWYVIEKTKTTSNCIVYNITKSEEAGEYTVEEISHHLLLAWTPYLKNGYHYKGTLKGLDTSVPAKMTVKFPLSLAGSSSFTVFSTDYDTYAGIFTCQKLPFSHRRSAAILSRTRFLDKAYVDKIRNQLAYVNIDPNDLSPIRQTSCPKDINVSYNITTTWSAPGDNIGNGFFEFRNGLSKSRDLFNGAIEPEADANQTVEPDAEWFP